MLSLSDRFTQIALIVLLIYGVFCVRAIAKWFWNNKQPVQSVVARLVTKRVDVPKPHLGDGADAGIYPSFFFTYSLHSV